MNKKIYKVHGRKTDKDFDCYQPVVLENHMGEKPIHFPETKVALSYSDKGVHVFFRVKERFLRIEEKSDQGRIWEDSCVEFFFSPFEDVSDGYFNIEMNAIGRMLFNFQKARGVENIEISKDDLKKIKRFSSLSGDFVHSGDDLITWSIDYEVPFDLIKKYSPYFLRPEKGVRWFANFYKCGDKTKYPHWLTWNRVEKDKPDFHRPEYFGVLEFV